MISKNISREMTNNTSAHVILVIIIIFNCFFRLFNTWMRYQIALTKTMTSLTTEMHLICSNKFYTEIQKNPLKSTFFVLPNLSNRPSVHFWTLFVFKKVFSIKLSIK